MCFYSGYYYLLRSGSVGNSNGPLNGPDNRPPLPLRDFVGHHAEGRRSLSDPQLCVTRLGRALAATENIRF